MGIMGNETAIMKFRVINMESDSSGIRRITKHSTQNHVKKPKKIQSAEIRGEALVFVEF